MVQEGVGLAPESLYASGLLLEVVREEHPDLLPLWLPLASAIEDAAKVRLPTPFPSSSCRAA